MAIFLVLLLIAIFKGLWDTMTTKKLPPFRDNETASQFYKDAHKNGWQNAEKRWERRYYS